MKYALLVYMPASWSEVPSEEKRGFHRAQRDVHDECQAHSDASVRVIAHYRARPSKHTMTVRGAGGEIVRNPGPATEAAEALRALYIIEGDAKDAVFDFATQMPAVHMGATAEVWPLIESVPPAHGRRGHRGRAAR